MKVIIVTGGTGFLGSHICVSLLEQGYSVLILDSFINSSPKTIDKIREIKSYSKKFSNADVKAIKCDLRDKELLKKIFSRYSRNNQKIEAVIHLAGLKAVNESIIDPIKYWENNVNGSINLLKAMDIFGCRNIVFSSSATIYGYQKNKSPINENAEIKPINTYGKTKEVIENILESLSFSTDKSWKIAILRYFNPIGAHKTGLIGENPNLTPTNIIPIINQVALRKREFLEIYGSDWDTIDGTCVRDYIHVMDLAEGHVKALKYILNKKSELIKVNLGNGEGVSVLNLVKTFQKINGVEIPFKFVSRRKGDIPYSVADNSFAKTKINWEPVLDLEAMCRDSWNFAKQSK